MTAARDYLIAKQGAVLQFLHRADQFLWVSHADNIGFHGWDGETGEIKWMVMGQDGFTRSSGTGHR